MSYSFLIKTPTKAQAVEQVAAKFEQIAVTQSCHHQDRQQALAAATAFINLLPDDPAKDVSVSVSGSLSGVWERGELIAMTAAQLSLNASLVAR